MTPLAAARIVYLLLAANAAISLVALILHFIPSDMAITLAFVYAGLCALLYMLAVKFIVDNIHRLPADRPTGFHAELESCYANDSDDAGDVWFRICCFRTGDRLFLHMGSWPKR